MLLDMTQILSGAVDRLEFSYTLSADCIPYEGAPETEDETDAVQTAKVGEDEGIYPIVFDDVVVLAPVSVTGVTPADGNISAIDYQGVGTKDVVFNVQNADSPSDFNYSASGTGFLVKNATYANIDA